MTAQIKSVDAAVAKDTSTQGNTVRELKYYYKKEGNHSVWLTYRDDNARYSDGALQDLRQNIPSYRIRNGEYKIPLGRARTISIADDPEKTELELMPVFPARFADANGEKLAHLRQGWLYVFIDGHLWREIKYDSFYSYNDVNLVMYQGMDTRPAYVESQGRALLLPERINGEKVTLQIAYSEVQWSWAYIERLGGMSEDDPRYLKNLELNRKYKKQVQSDSTARDARMQTVDLEKYHPGGDGSDAWDSFLVPVKTAYEKNKAGLWQLIPLPEMNQNDIESGLPVLVLQDPLAIAQENLSSYLTAWSYLAEDLEHIQQTEPHYRSAVLAYQLFYNEQFTKKTEEVTIYEDVGTESTELVTRKTEFGKAAPNLSRDRIESILRVSIRREHRAAARDKGRIHVEWLKGMVDGKPVDKPGFISVTTALKDFFALSDENYFDAFLALNGLLSCVGEDVSVADSGHDLPENNDAPDMADDLGFQFLAELLEPTHELHSMLFPDENQVDAWSPKDPETDTTKEINDGSGKFRPGAFATAYAAGKTRGALSQENRRAAQLVDELMAAYERTLAAMTTRFQRVYRRAIKSGKYNVSFEAVIRLAKASGIPELRGMHLMEVDAASAGTTLKQKKMVVLHASHGKLRDLDINDRVRVTKEVYDAQKRKHFRIIDKQTGEVLAYGARKQIALFRGYQPTGSWLDLVQPASSSGATKGGKITLVVVPEDNPVGKLAEQLKNKADTSLKKTLKAAYKRLPLLLVAFEIWNVNQVKEYIKKSGRSNFYSNAALFSAYADLSYALADGVHRMASGGVKKYLGRTLFFRNGLSGLRILGSFACFVSAGVSAMDAMKEWGEADEDAAFGHMIATAGFALWGLSILGGSGAIGFLSVFGPWGWAAIGLVLLGVIIASVFNDTELEEWTKHGPFAKEKKYVDRFRYLAHGPYAYQQIATLLYTPAVTINKLTSPVSDEEKAGDVVVIVQLAQFSIGKSSLDVRVTSSADITASAHNPKWAKQEIEAPYQVKQVMKDGALVGLEYYYRAKSLAVAHRFKWYAKARIVTEENETIPFIKPAPDAPFPEQTTGSADVQSTAAQAVLHAAAGALDSYEVDPDGEYPGWSYAESEIIKAVSSL